MNAEMGEHPASGSSVESLPEEQQLQEALDILNRLLSPAVLGKLAFLGYIEDVTRARDLVANVLTTLPDYGHATARVEELEDELDSRDAEISELQDRVESIAAERGE